MRGWRPWTVQPPPGTPIDWDRPLTQGLTFCYVPTSPVDLARGRRGTWVGTVPALIAGSAGVTANWSGTSSIAFSRDVLLEPPNNLTIACYLRFSSLSAQAIPLCKAYQNATNESYGLFLDYGGYGEIAFSIYDGNTPNARNSFSSSGAPFLLSGVNDFKNGLLTLYQDSNVLASNPASIVPTYDRTSSGDLIIGGASATAVSSPMIGEIYLAAVWERALSSTSVAGLAANPWQIFHRRRRAYSIVQSSGGATGTAAITEGADTVSATGNIAIPGTASITEASDTVAATGALAIAGTAAITEGSDTVAATGVGGEVGTAAITEASDVAAGTGALALPATAAITESDDAVSATGNVTIPGTASILEGGDIVVGTGAITGAGAAAIVEGSDIVIAQGSGPQPVNPMPNFIGFPINYVIQILAPKGIAATLSYQFADPPGTTMGIITAQSPAAGQELKAPVSFTCTGAIALPAVGVRSGNVPALLVGNNDNPGGRSANS